MHKYVYILLLVILITGCESKTEYFDKVCTSKVKSDIVQKEKKKIIYNNYDQVTKVVIKKTYISKKESETIKNIKEALEDYNNDLSESSAIKIRVITDEENKYVLKYTLKVQKMTDEELELFDINKNSVKYLNKLRENNENCV